MSKLNATHRFDTRILNRNIAQGVITKDELSAHTDALEDVRENVELVLLDQPGIAKAEAAEESKGG